MSHWVKNAKIARPKQGLNSLGRISPNTKTGCRMSRERLEKIDISLVEHGLQRLGMLHAETSDNLPQGTGTLVLVGPSAKMWPIFEKSAFAADKAANPLDRWSYHVLSGVAQNLGARALFPFGGPPFLPFISWAAQSGSCWPSPVGLLVHETAGLFVSFRGALAFDETFERDAATPRNPCLSCHRPCLDACPVGALGAQGYDVPGCKSYLASQGTDCMAAGCAVRRACPVGAEARTPEQSAFHMRAFLG